MVGGADAGVGGAGGAGSGVDVAGWVGADGWRNGDGVVVPSAVLADVGGCVGGGDGAGHGGGESDGVGGPVGQSPGGDDGGDDCLGVLGLVVAGFEVRGVMVVLDVVFVLEG